MNILQELIYTILSLPEADRSRDHVVKLKRQRSKKHGKTKVPTNLQVLKTFYGLRTAGEVEDNDWIEWLLKKRGIRSQSWIVAVQVLTKPFRCPGKCIFCPNDATMPKSYINTQPWAMRALLNQFDPYKQVYNRLLSLTLTGHKTDKIEMIVLWWTWDVYPKAYKIEFVKWLYDACNTFLAFMDHIEVDFSSDKSARYTVTEDFEVKYPTDIQESLKINETAPNRIIWLTIETRPEYVTDENCQLWRDLWVTRVEMGIQTLHNPVHEANVRGHDNQAIKDAMYKLRQYGFKISNHYMPGLYTSTPEMDLETFQIAFSTPRIKSDELKFYPTAVIPNTPLYDLYKSWEYEPIKDDDLKKLIKQFKTEIIQPYSRIKRLARDFDTNEVVAGANTPNLRQLVMNDMQKEYNEHEDLRKKQYTRLATDSQQFDTKNDFLTHITTPLVKNITRHISLSNEEREIDHTMETSCIGASFDTNSERNFVCLCTRCREFRNKDKESLDLPFPVVRRYHSSNGEECFISIEDTLGYLYGFARLLLPADGVALDYEWVESDKALIRELHVYGSLSEILSKQKKEEAEKNDNIIKNTAQDKWFGTQMMELAQDIARVRDYEALSVISWIGVKGYYKKLWFEEVGTYMVKSLN